MGVFLPILLVALQIIPALDPASRPRRRCCRARCSASTSSSLLFAYASFALACVIGITYVLLFKEIKAKHLGFFYARLPSLQVLDLMNRRVVIGWVFLTIGIVVGGIWAIAGPDVARPAGAGDVVRRQSRRSSGYRTSSCR